MGARKPSDAGFYFQWGDTKGYAADQVGTGDGKKKFADDWSDYKWNPSGDGETFTKYIFHSTLELEDDAAHVNMGGDWHMPTDEQINELRHNTSIAWTTQDGVNGMRFTSKKDPSKSIFIPAAGYALNGSVIKSGEVGAIWFDRIESNYGGCCIYADTSGNNRTKLQRYYGLPIRGVIDG